MLKVGANAEPELLSAYAEYEREIAIQKYRVAALLGVVFMPGGITLDLFVYPKQVPLFFVLRLISAGLLLALWYVLGTDRGRRHYKTLGMIEVSIPLFFIAWMIYAVRDPYGLYYAGLNLVVMGAGIILRWTLLESVWLMLIALGMYAGATLLSGVQLHSGVFFNNIYFLLVTGVFAMAGNYLYSQTRFREFELRYELDKSRRVIEENHRQLVELDQVKSRFFANISHELRTPLTLLLAPLERLKQDFANAPEEIQDLLGTMQSNGMRLLKLINDLLDLVRLESGQMRVKEDVVAVEPFFLGLAQSVRQVAADKKLKLETRVEGLDEVVIDRDKLEKISLNLLFNALKFTQAGGSVKVSAKRDSDQWVLEVSDTGMGIAPEQMQNVFRRFWQADTSSQRKFQGAGIGLALVKELVEVQKGTVSVQSEVGKGTTFTARFPFVEPSADLIREETPAAPASDRATTPAAPGLGQEWLANLYRRAELFPSMTSVRESVRPVELLSGGNRPVLLIADDEPDMLRFLKTHLQRDCQIIEAVDGQQAVEKATQFMPDMILLDMMMPEVDGLQACRMLRERSTTERIPIILLTARADEETKLAALQAGASDFLTKPFSTTELSVRVKNLIEGRTFEKKLRRQNQILEATLQQLKDTETQLVQTEKLASLGRMSAGIIHEINNPLNFAKTAIYTLKSYSKALPEDEKPDFDDVLKDITDGIDRVRTIVSDLRTFTHPNLANFGEVKFENVVTAALRFLSHDWKERVEVTRDIEEGITVWANEHQLIQVILNLLQNSLDAMKKKDFGEDKPRLLIEAKTVGSHAVIRIRDNGPGISSDNISKIFDPFFTTKDVGEGMGLGLSICYKIIQAHEGRITVNSEVNSFCEFTLELPVSAQEPEPAMTA